MTGSNPDATRDVDEFALMDGFQDSLEAVMAERFPVEPDKEFREQTAHEQPVDLGDGDDFETDDIPAINDNLPDLTDVLENPIEEDLDL